MADEMTEAPVEEQPVEEQPVEEQPVEEQPVEEQPVEEQPVEEQPVEEQPVEEQPVEEQPVEEQPVEEQPVEEQPARNGGPRIVINPTTFENRKDALCVAFNEAFRVVMEYIGFDPLSRPTHRQRRFFSDTAYSNDENMLRRTILARIATFDTSVKDPTDEQVEETVEFLQTVLEEGIPQNDWEKKSVQNILNVLQEGLDLRTGSSQEEPAQEEPAQEEPAQEEPAQEERADVNGGQADEEEDLGDGDLGAREFGDGDLSEAGHEDPAGTAAEFKFTGTMNKFFIDNAMEKMVRGDMHGGETDDEPGKWTAGDRVDIGKGMYLVKGEKEGTGTVFGAGDDSKMADVTDFIQGAFEDGRGNWFRWTDSLTGLDKEYRYDGDGNAMGRKTERYGEYRPGGGSGSHTTDYKADGTREVLESIDKADGGYAAIHVTYSAGGNRPTDIWGATSLGIGSTVLLDKDDFNGKPVSLENTASAIEQHRARRSAEGIGKARDYGDLPGMQKPSHPAAPDDITAQFQAQYDGSKGDAGDLANPPQPGTGSAPDAKTDKVEPKDVTGNDTVEVFGNGFGQAATGTEQNTGFKEPAPAQAPAQAPEKREIARGADGFYHGPDGRIMAKWAAEKAFAREAAKNPARAPAQAPARALAQALAQAPARAPAQALAQAPAQDPTRSLGIQGIRAGVHRDNKGVWRDRSGVKVGRIDAARFGIDLNDLS